MKKTGFLLINLGTPDAPTPKAVGRYLKQFLMDPGVIQIPWIFRVILVYGIIVPRRKFASSKLYSKIWQKEGSPLKINTQRLVQKLEGHFESIHFAMRYGSPSIESVITKMTSDGVENLKILPLFPQYAQATTGSVEAEVRSVLKKIGKSDICLTIVKDFYSDPLYIDAVVSKGLDRWNSGKFDAVLLSYHGLPSEQLKKESLECESSQNCCDKIGVNNRYCYKAQCMVGAKMIFEKLGVPKSQQFVSFQSRLGRAEWIRPYTEDVIRELPKKGIKNILVFTPAFVSDCLETIEEIGMSIKEVYLKSGGEIFERVDCPNDSGQMLEVVKSNLSLI